MKKIFAISLIAMTAVTAANAEIASKAYVDQQDGAVGAIIGALTDLGTTEKGSVVAAINEVNTAVGAVNYSGKADKAENLTGATKTKITYNDQGIVTAGADLAEADIPALSISKTTGLQDALNAKANTANLGALATKNTVADAEIAANAAIAKSKLAATVQTSLGLADSAVQPSEITDMLTKTEAGTTYVPRTTTVNTKALSGNVVLAGSDVAVTGYTKATGAAAIAATDTVNTALGKLEYKVDAVPAQQSADWNATSGVTQILNKPTLGELAALDEVAEANLASALANKIDGKADKATTLAGYGITDAYTKTETDTALAGKQATLTTAQQDAVNSGITNALVTQIGTNQSAITTLNGDANTTGSVAKAVADATSTLNAAINDKADAATTLAGYGITDAYTKTETASAIDTKVATLDGTTTGTGNVVDSVTEADGIVTVTKNVTAVTVPATNENSTAGTYVLTSEIAQDGTKTYHWELITRAQ